MECKNYKVEVNLKCILWEVWWIWLNISSMFLDPSRYFYASILSCMYKGEKLFLNYSFSWVHSRSILDQRWNGGFISTLDLLMNLLYTEIWHYRSLPPWLIKLFCNQPNYCFQFIIRITVITLEFTVCFIWSFYSHQPFVHSFWMIYFLRVHSLGVNRFGGNRSSAYIWLIK